MVNRIKRAAAVICMLMITFALASCGSDGSLQDTVDSAKEKIDSAKETAEQKYNEFAEGIQGENADAIDEQSGYLMDDGSYCVVIKNMSEEQTLSKYAVKYEAYDAEDDLIEPAGFPPASTVGPVFPGKSAVMYDWGSDEWAEEPARMSHTMKIANWGNSQKRVYISETTENYYQNYTITIKNDGNSDVDLQSDYEHIPFSLFAVFRDDEGKVTGVSGAYPDEFIGYESDGKTIKYSFPVIPAGEELTTNVSVYDIYPGTAEITMTWNQLSSRY